MPVNGPIASECPQRAGWKAAFSRRYPHNFELGTYSPLLDSHGNSVRGLKVCEALSSRFDLHVLIRGDDVRTCVTPDYDIGVGSSRRSRPKKERQILMEHRNDVRIIELVGALTFASLDYVSRGNSSLWGRYPQIIVIDFHRVPSVTKAAAQLLGEVLHDLTAKEGTAVLSGMSERPRYGRASRNGSQTITRESKPFLAGRGYRMGRGSTYLPIRRMAGNDPSIAG